MTPKVRYATRIEFSGGAVLITALLLTFGAPFWFERLQDVAKLRDALSPPKPKTRKQNATQSREEEPE